MNLMEEMMKYRRIYFRECPEEIPEREFEYQINFVLGEGSISYVNNGGGRTTRGIKINSDVLNHIKLILDKGKPEQYRENLDVENCLKMDGWIWQFVIDYSDGKAELQIDNYDEDSLGINKQYKVPAFIFELKKLISTITYNYLKCHNGLF